RAHQRALAPAPGAGAGGDRVPRPGGLYPRPLVPGDALALGPGPTAQRLRARIRRPPPRAEAPGRPVGAVGPRTPPGRRSSRQLVLGHGPGGPRAGERLIDVAAGRLGRGVRPGTGPRRPGRNGAPRLPAPAARLAAGL